MNSPIRKMAGSIYHGALNKLLAATYNREINSKTSWTDKPVVKVVSYFGWQNGISQGAVSQHGALRQLGYQTDVVDITQSMGNPFIHIPSGPADIFIIHCGGSQFLRAAWPLRDVLRTGKVIAFLVWEFAEPPTDWAQAPGWWDEIWTPSRFSAKALSQWCDCTIRVIPPLVFRGSETPKQWDKGVEPLRFLTMADARSSLSRKNPIGAVKAFRSAFPNETDVELTVKLHKTDVRESAELRRLLDEISQDSRIRLIDRTLERNELEQLLLSCHSFVSLHRAEGFGLPILEAQTFGLATIVTGWSGNLDFTNDETSLVIPYTMTTTHDTGNVYGRVRWADPDLQSAARAMRKLYDSPGELARIAAAGWNAHRPERQLDHFAKSFKSYVG